MTGRRYLLVLAVGLAGACSTGHADLERYFQEVEARGESQSAIAPVPAVPPLPAYDAHIDRDPFKTAPPERPTHS